MATIYLVYSHLDNLVLDYIDRRWKISRESILPHKKEEHRQTTQDITLEEIYLLHFVGSRSCKDKTLKNIMHSTQSCNSLSKNLNMHSPLPRLPLEIVEHILQFGSIKQLRSLRCLSQSVNNSLCKRLQQYHVHDSSINLECQCRTEGFVNYFENRMGHLKLPFRAVNLGKNWAAIPQLLKIIGSQLVVNLQDLEANELSRDVLAKMANVCSLSVRGFPNVTELLSTKEVSLPALRHLDLQQNPDEQRLAAQLKFEYILAWLRLAPSLTKFISTIPTKLAPAQATQLFTTHTSLSAIHIDGFAIYWKDGELNVVLTMKAKFGLTAAELESYAPFVRLLSVHDESPLQLPPFPRLTILDINPPGPLRPIQLNDTPLLDRVRVESAIQIKFCEKYRDFVFECVGFLRISDESWTWDESHPPLFHLIFPKLHTLDLSGPLCNEFINYFAAHFKGVSNLRFEYYEHGDPANWPIFQVRVPGRKEIEWPFFNFPNLKKVEFACEDGLRNTVLTLVWLTLNKYIQPIQELRIVPLPTVELKDGGERGFYYSMHHLNYHKELEFSVERLY